MYYILSISFAQEFGDEIVGGEAGGRYEIDTLTHSLIINDVAASDFMHGGFQCSASNRFANATSQLLRMSFNTNKLPMGTNSMCHSSD